MEIPESWTFKSKDIANDFDKHVVEQLPWYPLVSDMVRHIATCYLQDNNVLFDVGCSLGEVTHRLKDVIIARNITCYSIDPSSEMIKRFYGIGEVINSRIEDLENIPNYNVCVCMLSIMFTDICKRSIIIRMLIDKCIIGGCIIVVDKIEQCSGYLGTCISRMSINAKLKSGVNPDDILKKELSLCGVQRPTNESIYIGEGFKKWFQLGDFVGYVYEKI
jgi:tRNA (cmo5U34)-methyltransferase